MADFTPQTIPLGSLAPAAAFGGELSREERTRRTGRAGAASRVPQDGAGPGDRPRVALHRGRRGEPGSGTAGALRPLAERSRHSAASVERTRRGIPHCPSAQAWQEGAFAFGVVGGAVGERRVGYLEGRVPVSDALLALTGPVKPTEVFRFAAPCNGTPCRHFNGHDCNLIPKLVQLKPPVSRALPACRLRPDCRWWLQVGKRACHRCPAIMTECYSPSEDERRAADPRTPVPVPAAETDAA
jgi:hypothetical protein